MVVNVTTAITAAAEHRRANRVDALPERVSVAVAESNGQCYRISVVPLGHTYLHPADAVVRVVVGGLEQRLCRTKKVKGKLKWVSLVEARSLTPPSLTHLPLARSLQALELHHDCPPLLAFSDGLELREPLFGGCVAPVQLELAPVFGEVPVCVLGQQAAHQGVVDRNDPNRARRVEALRRAKRGAF